MSVILMLKRDRDVFLKSHIFALVARAFYKRFDNTCSGKKFTRKLGPQNIYEATKSLYKITVSGAAAAARPTQHYDIVTWMPYVARSLSLVLAM